MNKPDVLFNVIEFYENNIQELIALIYAIK